MQFAATEHYRQGNPVPVVFRAPCGGGAHAGPFHSQSPEAWFVHTAGLKVVMPSNPYDAKGLLIAAIRDPNPVVFLEPKFLYRRQKGEVPADTYTVPLGPVGLPRAGDDLSIICFGAMVPEALQASETLATEEISCEIVDVRTLAPMDTSGVLTSVRKTGRALIVHEARRTAGVGAELSAMISEHAFESLDAPITRLTAPDTPVPYSPPLEREYRPDADSITVAARNLATY